MKILKSGVEMTPEELIESRGGATCACGCEGGFSSQQLWTSSKIGGGCICGCTTPSDAPDPSISTVWGSPADSARNYLG